MRRTHNLTSFTSIFTVFVLCLTVAEARQSERTSENTPQLKTLLERQPKADLNKDGVLT